MSKNPVFDFYQEVRKVRGIGPRYLRLIKEEGIENWSDLHSALTDPNFTTPYPSTIGLQDNWIYSSFRQHRGTGKLIKKGENLLIACEKHLPSPILPALAIMMDHQ